eukprot:7129043-Alexandrium_andersonii.AAC.1
MPSDGGQSPSRFAAAAGSTDPNGSGMTFGQGRMPSVKLRTLDKTLAKSPGGYKEWRKEILVLKHVNKIEPTDLAPLVYLSLGVGEGQPRQL